MESSNEPIIPATVSFRIFLQCSWNALRVPELYPFHVFEVQAVARQKIPVRSHHRDTKQTTIQLADGDGPEPLSAGSVFLGIVDIQYFTALVGILLQAGSVVETAVVEAGHRGPDHIVWGSADGLFELVAAGRILKLARVLGIEVETAGKASAINFK